LVPWTASTAIKPGEAVNLLRVIAQDIHLILFVNNVQVANVIDITFKAGVVGPVALEEGHAVVSEMQVWTLPDQQTNTLYALKP
jgi:hypothetical protein